MTNIPIPDTSFELGYGASKSQTLDMTPVQVQELPNHPGYYAEGAYTLKFSVVNSTIPTPSNYPGYYDVELSFGSQELGSADGWGVRASTQVTVTWPSPGYILADKSLPDGGPVQGNSKFVLKFSVPGWQLKFDNISLTFTPSS